MIDLPTYAAPRSPLRRMMSASFGQKKITPRCPDTPRLDGWLAVVTGATGGIGLGIAQGLVRRGAELILPCRDLAKGQRVVEKLRADAASAARIDLVEADLEDLESVRHGAEDIARVAAGRRVRLLVENAGIWPRLPSKRRESWCSPATSTSWRPLVPLTSGGTAASAA